MAQYMHVHTKVRASTAEAVVRAHDRHVDVHRRDGVTFRRYWHDEVSGKLFCLVEAPDRETAAAVQDGAGGLGHGPCLTEEAC